MLECMGARSPGLALNEIDDVLGAQRAKVDAFAAEAINEELANGPPVPAGRADGESSVT